VFAGSRKFLRVAEREIAIFTSRRSCGLRFLRRGLELWLYSFRSHGRDYPRGLLTCCTKKNRTTDKGVVLAGARKAASVRLPAGARAQIKAPESRRTGEGEGMGAPENVGGMVPLLWQLQHASVFTFS